VEEQLALIPLAAREQSTHGSNGDDKIVCRCVPDILDTVQIIAGRKAYATWPEAMRLSIDGQFHIAFSD
jgi:hypothetical protein